MVVGNLFQHAVAETIEATVAAIHPIVLVVVEDYAHERRTHLGHLGIDVTL